METISKKILVTGATGNIGEAVVRYLVAMNPQDKIVVGMRDIKKAQKILPYQSIEFVEFDFENELSFEAALKGVDRIFLLRPPQISDIDRYFKPLIKTIYDLGIREVVFLSVSGAEKSSLIPHHKIEKLIVEYGLEYIFVRPSYFMQNLTTVMRDQIRLDRCIKLPSGLAKFNWIDVENIAEISAKFLVDFTSYKNQAILITGNENESYQTVADKLSVLLDKPIGYKSVNPISFYLNQKKSGMPLGMIAVIFILHFLPRFKAEPQISKSFEEIMGKKPNSLNEFIKRELQKWK